jgi:hypothetical protein
VHHQSEDYNLSVALRQSWFQSFFSFAFYLPLAIVGFEPLMFAVVISFNTLYQFWIHTETIGKLGPLEWVFNTPSHHRVHHGSNPKYIDKNHAGSLIIWDRLFGTFQEEDEKVYYGITSPLNSWNPVWANFHYWVELWELSKRSRGIKNKVLVFIKPPGWQPAELGGIQHPKDIDIQHYHKYNTHSSKPVEVYSFVQFVLILGLATAVLFLSSQFSKSQLLQLAFGIIGGLTAIGAYFENKKWAVPLDYFRLALIIQFLVQCNIVWLRYSALVFALSVVWLVIRWIRK